MPKTMFKEILPSVYHVQDACNVYLLKCGEDAIAVDFGSGKWLAHLAEIGVKNLRHVLLTHAHRDQCYGLGTQTEWPFEVHCSGEDGRFFQADRLQAFWRTYQAGGCPPNYLAPRVPLPFVKGDVGDASELVWDGVTVGVVPTPGHTRGAVSYVVNWQGKSIVFCGDAVLENGKLHQPYHLEWDHWTGEGALSAWYGLERLGGCRIDLLCPSHGAVVAKGARACVRQTQKRILAFVKAKGSVCAGAIDHWFGVEALGNGISRVLPNLFMWGGNTYLLAGQNGEGLVIDPTLPSIERIGEVMAIAGVDRVTVATATHYHRDHSDGLNWVRKQYGAKVWLHPWVAKPMVDRNVMDVPWLPADSIVPDRLLPEEGAFKWGEYDFQIRPFPGQTLWHCAFDTDIFGQHVLFSGDNFQPPTRWNGTGGFCAFNGSRFIDGFGRSAQVVLDLKPDLICNGHGCVYRYDADLYRRILKWATQAEKAVRDLCPSGDWVQDYDPRMMGWEPFRTEARAGQTITLRFYVENARDQKVSVTVSPTLPEGWTSKQRQRSLTVLGHKKRRISFDVVIPKKIKGGRFLIGGEVGGNGQLMGEVAVAIVDIVER